MTIGILGYCHMAAMLITMYMRAMLIAMSHDTGHLIVVCTKSLIIIPHKREWKLHMEDFKTTMA